MSQSNTVTWVKKPEVSNIQNKHYTRNRSPLMKSAIIKLPVGSIKPRGYLLEYIRRQKEGLTGNLGKISAWLQKDDNAWLSSEGKGAWGWEEVPYWLKGYANLGYLTDDEKFIDEARVWLDGAIRSQREDGDFGPQSGEGKEKDYWANMIMLFCLQDYYEYSEDDRVIKLMTKYFRFIEQQPEDELFQTYWQRHRVGDILFSCIWLYNRTGDKFLLDVAEKMQKNSVSWDEKGTLPNWHNVNIAQGFRQPAEYYLLSKDENDLKQAYDNFRLIREMYGQVPGGMFGGDENSRPGYTGPRQGVETCGMVEQMLSDEIMLEITADTFWADNCEDVAFNSFPAAVMPDFKALRYLTAPNMVQSDKENHSPGIENSGPFLMMNPFSSRCCQHNHSHGWPYYIAHSWKATADNGICAVLYGPVEMEAKVGERGEKVRIIEDTHYPFDEKINLIVSTARTVNFPLYLRIPSWCRKAVVKINGENIDCLPGQGGYIKISRTWNDLDTVELDLKMDIEVKKWEKNHNSVSVNYGPLTFSLFIKERLVRHESDKTAIGDSQWQDGADTKQWPSYEIFSDSAWNYGLAYDPDNLDESFVLERKAWPENNFPFTQDSVPLVIKAKGKIIKEWTLDEHKLCASLQDSPVKSDCEIDDICLIPMGAARLRISSLPVVGDGNTAVKWKKIIRIRM